MITLTGFLSGLAMDYASRKVKVSFDLVTGSPDKIKALEGQELKISVGKYRKKRSPDANAYYWVLVGKMADYMEVSSEEIHNKMICSYGQADTDEYGGALAIAMPSKIDISRRYDIYAKPTGVRWIDGEQWTDYILMRGSHTYDSKEMSLLINGVISEIEMNDMPIETIPPDELERMLNAWRPRN